MPDEQKPTVGRIVHFTPPQECKGKTTLDFYAAIITRVHGAILVNNQLIETVDLVTFGPSSVYFQHSIREAAVPTPNCWNWPPKN